MNAYGETTNREWLDLEAWIRQEERKRTQHFNFVPPIKEEREPQDDN